jgi:CPA2 family monovalent cation:H+ antiporter-2
MAIVFGIARAGGFAPGVALAAGLCLAQVGEFSFVLAQSARSAGSLDEGTFSLLVTVTIVSLALTPPAVALAGRLATFGPASPVAGATPGRSPRIVLVGFGPAGQAAAERLPAGIRAVTLVIDANPALVNLARSRGFPAELGDATRPDVLAHAGLRDAEAIAITVSDPEVTRQVAELARLEFPRLAILARSRYHLASATIARAGADRVIDEEELVGERVASAIVGIVGGGEAR